MHKIIVINDTDLEIKEYSGQRVLTFKDIDKIYNLPKGTSRKNFNRNKNYFLESVDYFKLNKNDLKDGIHALNIKVGPKGAILLTETGYLLMARFITKDSWYSQWNIQRTLINSYFKINHNNALYLLVQDMSEKLDKIYKQLNERISGLEEINESKESKETKEDNRLNSEQTIKHKEKVYKKPYNPWFTKMQPKYQLLEEYFNISRGQLYRNIILELENIYDIDTQQVYRDYCYENNLSSCYPLEPYEYDAKYKNMIESIVNNNLVKYGLATENDPIVSNKYVTVFSSNN